jgi:hypothetical protein
MRAFLGLLSIGVLGLTTGCSTSPHKPKFKKNAGGLTSEEIREVIVSNLSKIRMCYKTFLKEVPDTPGSVKAKFEIGRLGNVVAVKTLAATPKLGVLPSCINAEVSTWMFPKPRGADTVRVIYPFNFRNHKATIN